jgi:hypothetical protein
MSYSPSDRCDDCGKFQDCVCVDEPECDDPDDSDGDARTALAKLSRDVFIADRDLFGDGTDPAGWARLAATLTAAGWRRE